VRICHTVPEIFFVNYLRQGGYVIVVDCLFVCKQLCKKNFRTDLYESLKEGWHWATEQTVKFWWRSVSPSGYRYCFSDLSLLGDTERAWLTDMSLICQMAALVRRALAEVCSVPVILVHCNLTMGEKKDKSMEKEVDWINRRRSEDCGGDWRGSSG